MKVDELIAENNQLKSQIESLNKDLSRLKEIQKIDHEINEEVYKLYGLNQEERKVVEESLK